MIRPRIEAGHVAVRVRGPHALVESYGNRARTAEKAVVAPLTPRLTRMSPLPAPSVAHSQHSRHHPETTNERRHEQRGKSNPGSINGRVLEQRGVPMRFGAGSDRISAESVEVRDRIDP